MSRDQPFFNSNIQAVIASPLIEASKENKLSFQSIRTNAFNSLNKLAKSVGIFSNEEETLKKLAEKSCNPIWGKVDTILLTPENVDDPRIIDIVKAIVDVPYKIAFPDPSEQETAEELMRRVKERGNPKQFSTASFKNIDQAGSDARIIFNSKDPEEIKKAKERFSDNFVGLASVEDYVGKKTALIAYVLRSENCQEFPAGDMVRHGLEMIAENKKANNEKFVLAVWEANNPAAQKNYWRQDPNNPSVYIPNLEIDSMPPNTRIGVFENLFGARPLNIDYVQPPLSPESASCHGLIFYMIPYKGASDKEVAEAIKEYLNEFYRVLPDEKLNDIRNDGKSNYMEKYVNYCSERLNSIAEILKQNESEKNPDISMASLSDESKNYIEEKLLPLARDLSWKNGAKEDFKSLKESIDNEYATISAEIFRETLKSLQKELSVDALGVKKMESQLNEIINEKKVLCVKNLFDKDQYKIDSKRMNEYKLSILPKMTPEEQDIRKANQEELQEQKKANQEESKKKIISFIKDRAIDAHLHNSNPLNTINDGIQSSELPYVLKDVSTEILGPPSQLTNELLRVILDPFITPPKALKPSSEISVAFSASRLETKEKDGRG